jgi:hypothetical protein
MINIQMISNYINILPSQTSRFWTRVWLRKMCLINNCRKWQLHWCVACKWRVNTARATKCRRIIQYWITYQAYHRILFLIESRSYTWEFCCRNLVTKIQVLLFCYCWQSVGFNVDTETSAIRYTEFHGTIFIYPQHNLSVNTKDVILK